MQSIYTLLYESQYPKIKWNRATVDQIMPDLRKADRQLYLRYSQYDMNTMYNAGRLVKMNSEISSRLYNVPYTKVKTLSDIKGVFDDRKDQYNKIIEQYKSGEQIAPVILKITTGNYYCISDSPRLLIAKALGIVPAVYLIQKLSNRYTEPFQSRV